MDYEARPQEGEIDFDKMLEDLYNRFSKSFEKLAQVEREEAKRKLGTSLAGQIKEIIAGGCGCDRRCKDEPTDCGCLFDAVKVLELVKINAASIVLHLRDSKSHAAESVCDVISDRIMRME